MAKGNVRESNLDTPLTTKVNLISIPWSLVVIENDNYYMHVNFPVGMTVNTLTVETQAGGCEVTLYIGATPVTGLTLVTASTTKTTYTATAANTIAAGDTIMIQVANNISADTLGISVDGVEI
jgi:hypothetical protein